MKVHISHKGDNICIESVEVNGEVVASFDSETGKTDLSLLKSRTDLKCSSVELYINEEFQGETTFLEVAPDEGELDDESLDTMMFGPMTFKD